MDEFLVFQQALTRKQIAAIFDGTLFTESSSSSSQRERERERERERAKREDTRTNEEDKTQKANSVWKKKR